jgi:hypothetical protein
MKFLLTLFAITALFNVSSPAMAKKPLQVFILAGQSNMQGHAKVSTFEIIGMDPATKPMLNLMMGADGKPRVCERVWISSIGCSKDDTTEQTGKYGPYYHYLGSAKILSGIGKGLAEALAELNNFKITK